MKKSLLSYPLPAYVRFKLSEAGFTCLEDLQSIGSLDLSKDADISREEAANVLDLIFPSCHSKTVTASKNNIPNVSSALELLEKEHARSPIVTFCRKLDEMLDGGIPLSKITEICGTPGTGKTQLCLQLCVDVQIKEELGGLGGEAIFVDTEGSFSVERMVEIAEATVQHCRQSSTQKDKEISVESLLKGIHYYRCSNYVELIAIINLLPYEIESNQKVQLVIIDSIAFHFRYGFDGNFGNRTRILNGLMQSLIKLACDKNIAIVVTNQMTTRFDQENNAYLTPALGESWGHSSTLRLILFWDNLQRKALLYKSPSKKEDTVTFQITKAGIRDVVSVDREISGPEKITTVTACENPLRKRPRTDD